MKITQHQEIKKRSRTDHWLFSIKLGLALAATLFTGVSIAADEDMGCVSPEYWPNPYSEYVPEVEKCLKVVTNPDQSNCGTKESSFHCYQFLVTVTVTTYSKPGESSVDCDVNSNGWEPDSSDVQQGPQAYNNDTQCYDR